MAQTLSLPNYDEKNVLDHTELTEEVVAGAASLSVANTNDFTLTSFLLLGSTGSKNAEILQSDSIPTASTIPLVTSAQLPHNRYDNIYALFGDKLRIYRAPDVDDSPPADSIFQANLLATIDIDPNDDATIYTDISGGGGFWYKYTYYNSATHAETDLASATAIRGSFTTPYCSTADIRREAGFTYAPYITDTMIEPKRKAAQDEINGALIGLYNLPFQPPINSHIRDICTRLAAGLLLLEKYGHMTTSTTATATNGQSKADGARADLQRLVNGQDVLTDQAAKSLALPSTTSTAPSWPDGTTATTPRSEGGAPRQFRMGMIEGYRSREF